MTAFVWKIVVKHWQSPRYA